MKPQLQLIIYENNEIVKRLTSETEVEPSLLIKSIKEFQSSTNSLLTDLIRDKGLNDMNTKEIEGDDESEEEEDEPVSLKKRKR